jgi:hypothetical protein
MNRFLFDPGFQEMGVRICENATKVQVHHDSVNTQALFPNLKQPGDVEVMAHFFPVMIENSYKGKSSVNQLDGFFAMCGMPPIETVVLKLRELIQCGSDNGRAAQFPLQMGISLLEAMKKTFPNAHIFASDLIDMKTIELDFQPCVGGIYVELNCDMNMTCFEHLYA